MSRQIKARANLNARLQYYFRSERHFHVYTGHGCRGLVPPFLALRGHVPRNPIPGGPSTPLSDTFSRMLRYSLIPPIWGNQSGLFRPDIDSSGLHSALTWASPLSPGVPDTLMTILHLLTLGSQLQPPPLGTARFNFFKH